MHALTNNNKDVLQLQTTLMQEIFVCIISHLEFLSYIIILNFITLPQVCFGLGKNNSVWRA